MVSGAVSSMFASSENHFQSIATPKRSKKKIQLIPKFFLAHWTSSASFLEVTIVYFVCIYILYIYILYIYIYIYYIYILYIYILYIYYIYTIYILYIYILYIYTIYIYIYYIYTIYIYTIYIYTIYIYYIYIYYTYFAGAVQATNPFTTINIFSRQVRVCRKGDGGVASAMHPKNSRRLYQNSSKLNMNMFSRYPSLNLSKV